MSPPIFSKSAQIAVDVASDIAKKANAQLILLHVVEEIAGNSFNVEGQVDTSSNWDERVFTMKLIEKGKKQLAALNEDLASRGVRVKTELRLGTPFHGMRTILNDHKVDLVVMGTSGRSKPDEMIIGTNTEKVVRNSLCPVLTVNKKPSVSEFKKYCVCNFHE